MEINEKLLRQIIEDVLAEMQTSDKVRFISRTCLCNCLFQCQIPKIF